MTRFHAAGPTDLPIAELAALGGFFAVHPVVPPTGDWTPVTGVLADDAAVAALIDTTGERLGTGDRMVAASVLQFGWAARLVSIWAGCVELTGWAPDLGADVVVRRVPDAGGPVEIGLLELRRLDPPASWGRLFDEHLGDLATALARQVRLGRRMLVGNVASALAGALGVMERHGTASVTELVSRDWAAPPVLHGFGDWSGEPVRFRRTTCCAYDRVPGASRCGDCSLDRPTAADHRSITGCPAEPDIR